MRDPWPRAFASIRPDIVVNAAAYTAVDRAETERARAFAVNADGPGLLAEAAKRAGAMLVHYSTDYVFDGAAAAPYAETAPVAPLSVYGESKLEGERRVAAIGASALVFRTSWVYALERTNFLTTIRRLATQRDELRIVDDQIGVPNWSRALARATARVLGLDRGRARFARGALSSVLAGETTWFRVRAGFPARRAARATRADHHGRVSDACATPAVRRA